MFAIGQRWISESENDLGLGLVVGLDLRRVTLLFPIAQEQRVYAMNEAPLVRVEFKKGNIITSVEGWQLEVTAVLEENGCLTYQGVRLDNQQTVELPEIQLEHKISFSQPQERLFATQIDRNDRFNLRYQAWCYQQAQFQSTVRGLQGIRASLIPHQLHIAHEVGHRIAPRVLLADEVGLGKTIEAGMILQQQLFSHQVNRVLILVPENLQHQWIVEMLRRFSLHFSLFDEDRCADFTPDESQPRGEEENPFNTESRIICSLDWLANNPHRVEQLQTAGFDLLIVDEAHHLAWNPTQPSVKYQLVEQLAKQIEGVLLLTATPEQLGQASHFARLRLLDSERFFDYEAFLKEQNDYQVISEIADALLDQKSLTQEQLTQLKQLFAEDEVLLKQLQQSLKSDEPDRESREKWVKALIDRHGTSRVLFRNTRQSIQGFPERFYHPISLNYPESYAHLFAQRTTLGELTPKDSLYPERIMQAHHADYPWWQVDTRVDWLIGFLKQHRYQKTLVICQDASTVLQLEQVLREKEGMKVALFHENMSIIERDRAAAYFALPEEGAGVLICSSIGSEGRNFQFASQLVLFSLPHNPDLLEQCIGRLDRIGQHHPIQIYVPYFERTGQDYLQKWYHLGLNAFEATCPMGANLYEKLVTELESFLVGTTTELFDDFLKRTRALRQEYQNTLEKGRDRLLEMHSHGGEEAKKLVQQIAQQDGHAELVQFSLNLLDIIGVEQEDLGNQDIFIQPSSNMLVPDFPGLPEEGCRITFDRSLALAREELEFMTWDHPIIRNGIDLILSGDLGKTCVSLIQNPALPRGTLLLELIYIVEAQAPRELQLTRFLPPTPLRLLLDIKGNNLAPQVSMTTLEKQLKPIKWKLAINIVKLMRSSIENMLLLGEQKVKEEAEKVMTQATQQAESTLQFELARLVALQKMNKNIRNQEIQRLEQVYQQTLVHLAKANWRLDSLRVLCSQ